MNTILLLNARLVNEGAITETDIFIKEGRFEKIAPNLSHLPADRVIDVAGRYVLPGVIDDQVHFREPGLTHKATIGSEARAAVAGGTTTFMEMPNTVPNALTQELLEQKYARAAETSVANYSFFMGASNDNYDEAMRTDIRHVCGLKIFMGSSTGNMLVDNEATLGRLFGNFPSLIATHCEDEATVKADAARLKALYGTDVPYDIHAQVRTEQACYLSSAMAVRLAKEKGTRLHILHLSSSEELDLFRNDIPLEEKKITAEVCVHHLWFDAEDYRSKGNLIKCNPAIKHGHRDNLFAALLDNRLDIIATDHAPHTWDEKQAHYWEAPSGLPLVQHSLQTMLDFVQHGKISIERVAEKMSHAPAICFQIKERGFVREGYWADLVVVDTAKPYEVTKQNIVAKCGWSPFEGHTFSSTVTHTLVSGQVAFENGTIHDHVRGQRLVFER